MSVIQENLLDDRYALIAALRNRASAILSRGALCIECRDEKRRLRHSATAIKWQREHPKKAKEHTKNWQRKRREGYCLAKRKGPAS